MFDSHDDLARILISQEEIATRVGAISAQINRDYQDIGEAYFVGILKGAFIFLADLVRQVTVPHTVDFMALSSYGAGASTSGEVRILMDLRQPVEGRHVVIVEDIVDTGHTLSYLLRTLAGRDVASLRTCVLSRKKRAALEVPIDYLGFELPNVWVVGYGLDYADRYRTLPYIAELKREIYQPSDS